MEFLDYFRTIRRHWFLILCCVVVGVGIGVASAELQSTSPVKSRTYHKATHTLFFDPSANSNNYFRSAFSSLDQMAVLTTTGPVPTAVADELGSGKSGRELAEQITTLSNPAASTLEITAVDPDGDRATELADAFADELVKTLTAKDVARFDKIVADAQAQVDTLQGQINTLNAQIAANPPDVGLVRARLDGLTDNYSSAVSQLQSIKAAEAPTSALSTLEDAEDQPIDQAEYSARLERGQLGQNNLQVGSTSTAAADVVSASSTSLDGPVSRGIVAGVLGLAVGIGLALLVDHLDRRIRSRGEAEAAFRLPVITEVPKLDDKQQGAFAVLSFDTPRSGAAETFRAMRSALLFQHAMSASARSAPGELGAEPAPMFEPDELTPMTVMITSPSPREGKTTTAANLAAVFAETGATVLVVNCDFRRPMVHRYLGIQDTPRRVIGTRIPGVKAVTDVLSEADANPARVLAEQRRLINAARGQFDVMILDTAPLLSANDAVDLVGSSDLVVMVARAGQSTSTEAARASEMLDRVHAPVAGVVLIGTSESPNYYYANYRTDAAQQAVAATNGAAPKRGSKAKPPKQPKPVKVSRRERRATTRAASSSNGHVDSKVSPAPVGSDDAERA